VKRSLSLVIAILGLYNLSFGQGTTCATSEVLCDPNTTITATTGVASLGSVSCLGSTPNPAFYTLYISGSGNIDLALTDSPARDLDFAIWGPFTDPTGNCGATFPTGAIPDCSFAGGTTPEQIDFTGAQQGEFYMLLVTNFSDLATDITLAPNAGHTATLSGPLDFDLVSSGPFTTNSGVQDLETAPPSTDPSVTVNSFSGTGITNATTGEFDPSIAGIGTHTITVDGTSYGCPVIKSRDITVTNAITNLEIEVIRCNGDVADETLCPDETDDQALIDITVAFAAPLSATDGLLLIDLLGNTITATPIDITPGSVTLVDSTSYVFEDVAIPADGATTFDFQVQLYDTNPATIIDTETQTLAAEDPCSCFQYGCIDDTAFQAELSTGFTNDPDYTQEYILADLAGNILDRQSTAIYDLTGLSQGTIYAIYAFSYLTADAAVVNAANTIDALYNIEDVDPCVDAAISIAPCYLELPPNLVLDNADVCDDINQITIDGATGGLDPGVYCNATSNSTNGSFPYTMFIDNDNDLSNGFIGEADATAAPVTFTSATYPVLLVSEPTEFFVHLEDDTGCAETISVLVYPDYSVTVSTDVICLSPDETVSTIPDYELLTNLLISPAPPTVNIPGTWSSPDVFITDATLTTANIEGSTLDAQLVGSGTTTIDVNYTTAPGTPCAVTYGPFVLTLNRLDIPTPTAYTICEGQAIPGGAGLGSDCGLLTNWYDTNGTSFMSQVAAGAFFDPFGGLVPSVTPGTYTYFMECVDAAACTSELTGVSLTITSKPVAPTIVDETICENETTTDIIAPAGTSYSVTGLAGSVAALTTVTTANLTTAGLDAAATGTYAFSLVETDAAGCESEAGSFNIIVSPTPVVLASMDDNICDGSDITITASSTPADAATIYTWYSDAGLTATLGSGASLTVTPTATPTTYYVTSSLNSCLSASDNVVVTLSTATAPTGTDATACEGSTTSADYQLVAACGGGENVNWYDSASGGTLLLANSTTYTPSGASSLVDGTYTYYAECEDGGGCISLRTVVTLTIDAKPDTPIIADETICENGTATDILLTGGIGSSYTLVGPTGSAGPLAVTSITDTDLTGVGLDATNSGTYNFALTEISAASCVSDPGSFSITISEEPIVSASADETICDGSDITITASSVPIDVATIYSWFSDAGLTTPIGTGSTLTVTPTVTPTTFFVTASLNSCVSVTAADVVISLSSSAGPTGTDATACEGSTTLGDYELSAACGVGENTNWYDAATGGTLLLLNSTTNSC
jgi:hypothetical protein